MEGDSDKQSTVTCTVVAIDHYNLMYRVCSTCERTLTDLTTAAFATTTAATTSYSLIPNASICKHCNFNNSLNPFPTSSKRFFRILMSIATDTKVLVVIMFDRAARVLFGCSADDFFDFSKLHPFAAEDAAKVLEGEMLRVTLSKPKNGNAQHQRVVSVVPLRSGFRPAIEELRAFYKVGDCS